ncbi:NUDIX domain-containing protein [Candidatus Woesearchaeota archaeon]|nr:NUDIX domain-containing protein [Candidatus Woesearchaeota archaeon]
MGDGREIPAAVAQFAATLPRFPDGRIDYTNSDRAPVLTCFVYCCGELLLLKRSDKVGAYQGKWNAVAGYLDEPRPLRDKVLEELADELGVSESLVARLEAAPSYELHDAAIKKTWIIHPVLVELREKPVVKLDWEHTECAWIAPISLTQYDIVPGLDNTFAWLVEWLGDYD